MKILFDKPFLKIPVRFDAPSVKFLISDKSGIIFELNARYEAQAENADHFFFADVRRYMGKELDFSWDAEGVPCPAPELCEVRPEYRHCTGCADGENHPGSEKLRPRIHFTSPEGWLNDPNGLCFYEGKFHIFYQLNPCGNCWSNMTWGHAVSENLVDWEHLDIALFPDETGDMFSGSGFVDEKNLLGQNTADHTAMLLYYTAAAGHNVMSAGKNFEQYLAVSTDGGETFKTKFGERPVIPHIVGHNRDPKIVFHKGSGKYICSLYFENHKFGIFSSENLVDWKLLFELEVEGDDECPAFYPLTAPDGSEKWVAQGAFDKYIIGDFDGEKFTPETPVGTLSYTRRSAPQKATVSYAAQCFSGSPDGRCIRLCWLWTEPVEPFCSRGCFSVAQELSLRTLDGGLKLCAEPVKEVALLYKGTAACGSFDGCSEISLCGAANDIVLSFAENSRGITTIDIMGTVYTIDFDSRTASWTTPIGEKCEFTAPIFPIDGVYEMRFITDTLNVEAFLCGGSVGMCAFGELNIDSPCIRICGENSASYKINGLRDAIVKDSRTLK